MIEEPEVDGVRKQQRFFIPLNIGGFKLTPAARGGRTGRRTQPRSRYRRARTVETRRPVQARCDRSSPPFAAPGRGLERALRAEEPRLHARLRDMGPAPGSTAWQVVLGLSAVGLGLGLATAGTVAALPVLLSIGAGLTVAAPSLRPVGRRAVATGGTALAARPRRIAPSHAANVRCLPDHPGGGYFPVSRSVRAIRGYPAMCTTPVRRRSVRPWWRGVR